MLSQRMLVCLEGCWVSHCRTPAGTADAGLSRQLLHSQGTGYGSHQQQMQQQVSRPSNGLPSASLTQQQQQQQQQQLGLASADSSGPSPADLEGVLSQAHNAYRAGDFSRALQLCQTVMHSTACAKNSK